MSLFLAVSFDWEALLPLLLFLLYGLSQLLGSRKKGAEEEIFEEPDPDQAAEEERARQIREEIRRRVESQRQSDEASVSESRQPAPVAQQAAPRSRPEVSPARSSGDGGMIARLTEQKRRLEQARREKAKAERETRSIYDKARRAGSRYQRKAGAIETTALAEPGSVREDVLEILSDPANARRGILLSEILGPPVGSKPYQTDRF